MTTWKRVTGDTNDTIDVGVEGIDDATAASGWEAHVWITGASATTLTATATDTSTVRVNLGSWLGSLTLTSETAYNLEVQATVGGNPKTWPEGTPDQIIVRPAGG